LDTGRWWQEQTGLPLPLGGNVIRRDLGAVHIAAVSQLLRQSIQHGLEHRAQAIDWLLAQSQTLNSAAAVDHYLSLYANADTVDYGEAGRAGISELLRRGQSLGILPLCPEPDYAP
jgi:1,4-dihydroxy-6-naphthoate synthase